MKHWGIALIVAQIGIIYTALTQPELAKYGIGYPIFGVIGIILLIVARRKKIKSDTKAKYDEDD